MAVHPKIRQEVKKDIVEQVAESIEKSNEKLGDRIIASNKEISKELGDRIITKLDSNHQEMMIGFRQIGDVFGNVAENLSKINKTLEKIEKKLH